MRNAFLLSLLLAAAASTTARGEGAPQAQPAPAPKPAAPPATTQKPAPATPPATTAKPPAPAPAGAAPAAPAAAPPPVRRAPAPASARGGMAITVTDATGATIPGVRIAAEGPTQRGGETNGGGQANFPGLQGGVYRLRFDGDAVVSFEKEVTVRGGQVLAVDVMLNPAKKEAPPPPAPVAAPPPPVAAKTGPAGQPLQVNIPNVLEADFVGKNPRRESLLACSGNTRSSMLQVNQPTPERMYSDADVAYYVIGGEGTLKLNGKETKLALNDFVSIPRGGSHSFERRGGRTLVLLSVLGGEPCDAPK
jgi:mannose-6-phosphate isomerase-like protein (cupin superfamily)